MFEQRISWDWPSRMDETAGEQDVSINQIGLVTIASVREYFAIGKVSCGEIASTNLI